MKDVSMEPTIHVGDRIIERKVQYDGKVVEHDCRVLKADHGGLVLFHEIAVPFTMMANGESLTIPQGSYTIAHYWFDRPYNLYIWRDHKGGYLGSYFNIVRNTTLHAGVISFEDLIVDVLVTSDGEVAVLDLNELPEPLQQFEKGDVYRALQELVESLDILLLQLRNEADADFEHEKLVQWLA
ncbi:DUF402 domain-containing protein [Bacillus sp. KH172YL63]|uniref:DUF402 domain-containing protein n=1 Tax=Bacillus sp. KH172YL63 TaxID=2709784 RepID=UPI0013E41245|nr:DUF402 domain-containing protein [Bacillus sp. KH172YL63]BCB02660.1 hypothetical protein KH172YL63_07930 [Bacillus sp. KH172YL63]